jgi:hypothetical protein
MFQDFKIYEHEKDHWVSKESFTSRYNSRRPLTMQELHKKFMLKYETIFNWLCVYSTKEKFFWQNVKRYYERGVLDCFEVRLEEIVTSCTDITHK